MKKTVLYKNELREVSFEELTDLMETTTNYFLFEYKHERGFMQMDFEDLRQEFHVMLWKAFTTYDIEKGSIVTHYRWQVRQCKADLNRKEYSKKRTVREKDDGKREHASFCSEVNIEIQQNKNSWKDNRDNAFETSITENDSMKILEEKLEPLEYDVLLCLMEEAEGRRSNRRGIAKKHGISHSTLYRRWEYIVEKIQYVVFKNEVISF